ncbi:MAG: DUF87 domain-containing protein [Nitrosopumilus sp.]|nr:DUF87 domain-containing protein [Nitrosopumilus sp.]MDH3385639.1 DUF87 domain-containing protein [Nitrosopumilus sp.]
MEIYEKLGEFFLGKHYNLSNKQEEDVPLLYDAKNLTTHAVCVGMTGSGKTGLCVTLIEEAVLDKIPIIVIDPKGDLGNLLLTFPDLLPENFRPWINEDDARRKKLDPGDFAAKQAKMWKEGLASYGQTTKRVQELKDAADFVIYTPGSETGVPVSILSSFSAPSEEVLNEPDLFRDRISTTATSLLGLLGIDADPIQSREHILLSTLFDHLWRQGIEVDLGTIIQSIQNPPFQKVGFMQMETFFPEKDRFKFAMQINNLLAAPGFQGWLKGQPLDIDQIVHTPEGKPRVSIFSIAHLSEPERMFFVSLLLNQILSWMRTRSGTNSLRTLIYMDEIFGYMPPVAQPPSKKPLLTLLKQARAYGVGLVLATQNPADLDYKGLSNTGTWFIGRLQTERDKARMLDGLEGISNSSKFDRKSIDKTISSLGKRVFLLHNVHEAEPIIFHTRWAMSYLRGPLTRNQIKILMQDKKKIPTIDVKKVSTIAQSITKKQIKQTGSSNPVLPPGVPQFFVYDKNSLHNFQASVVGMATIHYEDPKTRKKIHTQKMSLMIYLDEDMVDVDWEEAETITLEQNQLKQRTPKQGTFTSLPDEATKARSYSKWKKEFKNYLYRTEGIELFESKNFDTTSKPLESERDFRIRLSETAREKRDDETEKLRKKYKVKTESLSEQLRKAKQRIQKEKEQSKGRKLQTAISIGASLLSAFSGGGGLNMSTLSRATTAVSHVARQGKEYGDVNRAGETIEAITAQIEGVNSELQQEIDKLEERYDPLSEELIIKELKPRKSDIDIKTVALVWISE